MRTLAALVVLLAAAAAAAPASAQAQTGATVQLTGGFARVAAEASINCTQLTGDGDQDARQVGPEDFEAEVDAFATGADLDEDCGVRATAFASQDTSVAAVGGTLAVVSRGAAGGSGTGEPSDDDGDFHIERFDGESVVSVGFEVTGGPVEFTLSGAHSGLVQTDGFSQAVVVDPTGRRRLRASRSPGSSSRAPTRSRGRRSARSFRPVAPPPARRRATRSPPSSATR